MLDEIHPHLPTPRDQNSYVLGRMGGHKVVIAVLPEIGNNAAAAVTIQLLNDFPAIRFGLLVGIGGGVPDEEEGGDDIRLGDVVISKPTATLAGVVQYDLGKYSSGGGFERTGTLDRPPPLLRASVESLAADHRIKGTQVSHYLDDMLRRYPAMEKDYSYPGSKQDQLFQADYPHAGGPDCKNCDKQRVVRRDDRRNTNPEFHYGTIGSANTVVKDAALRQELQRTFKLKCVEMEAAGVMDSFPCLVIRGICDYADSHKNKEWQPYAAATAAAYMKELLSVISPEDIQRALPATKVLSPHDILHITEKLDQMEENAFRSELQAEYTQQLAHEETRKHINSIANYIFSDRADHRNRSRQQLVGFKEGFYPPVPDQRFRRRTQSCATSHEPFPQPTREKRNLPEIEHVLPVGPAQRPQFNRRVQYVEASGWPSAAQELASAKDKITDPHSQTEGRDLRPKQDFPNYDWSTLWENVISDVPRTLLSLSPQETGRPLDVDKSIATNSKDVLECSNEALDLVPEESTTTAQIPEGPVTPREALVVTAVKFLQNPNIAHIPLERRINFMKSKMLTQEEVELALARSSGGHPPSIKPTRTDPIPARPVVQDPQWQQQQQMHRFQQPPVNRMPRNPQFVNQYASSDPGYGTGHFETLGQTHGLPGQQQQTATVRPGHTFLSATISGDARVVQGYLLDPRAPNMLERSHVFGDGVATGKAEMFGGNVTSEEMKGLRNQD